MKVRLALVILLSSQLISSGVGQTPSPTPTPVVPPPSQQQPQQAETDEVVRITTNLVQVDAVVTDKNGKIVTDLKPEEVEIYEDGREQKITQFSYTDTTSATLTTAPAPAAAKDAPPVRRLKPEEVRRTIALVVDDLGMSFNSLYDIRRALKKFVDEQMQPGDLVAIVRTAGGVGALQQFTSDKRQLYAAIERVKFSMNGRIGVSEPFGPNIGAGMDADTSGGDGPRSAGVPGVNTEGAEEEMKRFQDERLAVGMFGTLSYVIRGLNDLPGRKSAVLLSDGFPMPSDPYHRARFLERLQRIVDEAGRSSVVIYTINAAGLQTLGFTAADNVSGRGAQQIAALLSNRAQMAVSMQEGLDYLAQETGGLAIKNSNDLAGGVRRVLEDQKGFYLIGYRPDASTFDEPTGRRKFHKLTLKVKRQGKFNVRMRKGFYGISDEAVAAAQTLAQQMARAIVSPFSTAGVRLQLTSLFANDARIGSFMRSMLHLDTRDLTFTEEPGGILKATFDVAAITVGDNGQTVDQIFKGYTIRLKGDQRQIALRDGLVFYVTVPIKQSGAYQLRLALRDSATERIGSVSQFIQVPDIKKNRLAISGVVLMNQKLASGAGSESGGEGAEAGDAASSPAVRHFKPGTVMTYGFYIYNARLDRASNRPKLILQARLFHNGKEILTGRELPFDSEGQTDLKRLAAIGAIQLGSNMAPGEYQFQIVVTDLLAEQKHSKVTQWMDFQIVK